MPPSNKDQLAKATQVPNQMKLSFAPAPRAPGGTRQPTTGDGSSEDVPSPQDDKQDQVPATKRHRREQESGSEDEDRQLHPMKKSKRGKKLPTNEPKKQASTAKAAEGEEVVSKRTLRNTPEDPNRPADPSSHTEDEVESFTSLADVAAEYAEASQLRQRPATSIDPHSQPETNAEPTEIGEEDEVPAPIFQLLELPPLTADPSAPELWAVVTAYLNYSTSIQTELQKSTWPRGSDHQRERVLSTYQNQLQALLLSAQVWAPHLIQIIGNVLQTLTSYSTALLPTADPVITDPYKRGDGDFSKWRDIRELDSLAYRLRNITATDTDDYWKGITKLPLPGKNFHRKINFHLLPQSLRVALAKIEQLQFTTEESTAIIGFATEGNQSGDMIFRDFRAYLLRREVKRAFFLPTWSQNHFIQLKANLLKVWGLPADHDTTCRQVPSSWILLETQDIQRTVGSVEAGESKNANQLLEFFLPERPVSARSKAVNYDTRLKPVLRWTLHRAHDSDINTSIGVGRFHTLLRAKSKYSTVEFEALVLGERRKIESSHRCDHRHCLTPSHAVLEDTATNQSRNFCAH
ncbi:hypothetical protein DL98DRAFT_80736 [Cadophora sp. DSE1049]|nr:hypothetical protein DL98DRAFT_80736 [Cadophora sp. DSE1049]